MSVAWVHVFTPNPRGRRGSRPRARRASVRPSWPVSPGPKTAAGRTIVSGRAACISATASWCAWTFEVTYGSGSAIWTGADSVTGRSRGVGAKTPAVLVNTTRPTFSLRAAARTFAVPVTFTSIIRRNSRRPTSYSPATWNTTSARANDALNRGRVTSPSTICTPRASRSFTRTGSRVRTVTSQPSSWSVSTRGRPRSPVPPVTKARIPSPFLQHDREDVRILEAVVESDLLPRELRGCAPDVRVAESAAPVPMDRVAHHADVGTRLHDERIGHVGLFPLRLQEYPHEPEGLVDLVFQAREPDAFLRGDRHEPPLR